MRRVLALLANAFLIAFAADAVLSLADELARAALGTGALAGVRNAVALAPLALAPVMAAVLPFAPGLPLRAFLPGLIFLAWTLVGALPLPLWLPARWLGLAIVSLQVVLAALAFAGVRSRSPSRGWLAREADLAARPLRPLRALGLVALAAVLVPAAIATWAAHSVATALEVATGGFMDFGLAGIDAHEREYARGDRRVRLVGMMHVGEGDSYREVFASFEPDALVLAEGVSDRDGLLRDGLPYEKLADPLGLAVQPPLEDALAEAAEEAGEPGRVPEVERADLDLGDFSPETLDFLRGCADLMASPDRRTWLARARALSERFDSSTRARVLEDLVTRRNAHLLDRIDAALSTHQHVIVPWGALHLPEVERELLAWGFSRSGARSRRIVSYATLLEALGRRTAPPD